MRDHGGDLDRARTRFGNGDWLDLSTGINPLPYPMLPLPARVWARLPDPTDVKGLEAKAMAAYGTDLGCVALAGAQGAIQLTPRLNPPGAARVVGPTYNEHAGALCAQGWTVRQIPALEDLRGAELGILVNPNNPDGRHWDPGDILSVAGDTGLLVVDESFADPEPGISVVPHLRDQPILVLRSFGKFYGLAGLRLGFALGRGDLIARLRELAGPWAVSGPAIAIGQAALDDRAWQAQTRVRLAEDAARLDAMAIRAGWSLIGGTGLFRTYDAGDAAAAQNRLARHHIWTRIFPYSTSWIRLGLPGEAAGWQRLEAALPG